MIVDAHIGIGQSWKSGVAFVGAAFPQTARGTAYAYPSNSHGVCDGNYKFTDNALMNSDPGFAKRYYELTGRGSVWANVAIGNTALLQAGDNGSGWWDYRSSGSLYDAARAKIDEMLAALALSPSLQLARTVVHFAQGNADAGNYNGTTVTDALYKEAMAALFDKLKADYGVDIFGVYQLGHHIGDEANVDFAKIRDVQAQLISERTDTHMFCDKTTLPSPLTVDANGDWVSGFGYLADGVHPDRDSFYAMGRLGADALYALGGV